MPETIQRLPSRETAVPAETFYLNRGITHKQALQLIEFAAADPEVIDQTSDPKRFADRGSLERWLGKDGGRIIYTLVDKKDSLCGIVWFGRQDIPKGDFTHDFDSENYGITFAIRTYAGARNKGVSGRFMRGAIEDFTKKDFYRKTKNKGIWLETGETNSAARTAYEHNGWKYVTDVDKHGRLLMIYKPD